MTWACCGNMSFSWRTQMYRNLNAEIDRPSFKCLGIQKVGYIKVTCSERVGTTFQKLLASGLATWHSHWVVGKVMITRPLWAILQILQLLEGLSSLLVTRDAPIRIMPTGSSYFCTHCRWVSIHAWFPQ